MLSGDGAYVGLITGEWAEVRTLVSGEVENSSEPETEVQTPALSSFSPMTDAATVTDLAKVQTRRPEVVQAEAASVRSPMEPTGCKPSSMCIGWMLCASSIFRMLLSALA